MELVHGNISSVKSEQNTRLRYLELMLTNIYICIYIFVEYIRSK